MVKLTYPGNYQLTYHAACHIVSSPLDDDARNNGTDKRTQSPAHAANRQGSRVSTFRTKYTRVFCLQRIDRLLKQTKKKIINTPN